MFAQKSSFTDELSIIDGGSIQNLKGSSIK